MKKRVIWITFWAIFLVFLINSVSAISTNLKAEYERGESIIIEIQGSILEPIDSSDVEFLRGHVSVPLEYNLRIISGRYFLWAIAPQNANNYTLVINNVATSSGGKVTRESFRQNFSVNGNLTDYSIKPGFIFTNQDFTISVQLNEDSQKTINTSFPSERDIVLKPEKNDVKFSINSVNGSGFVDIKIGKYTLPAYIISEAKITPFEINPKRIDGIALSGKAIAYPFQIINLEDKKVDVSIEYQKDLFSIEKDFISLNPKAAVELNISLIGEIDETIKKQGLNNSIFIKSGSFSAELPIAIIFTEDEGEVETPYLDEYEELVYCPQLGGIVCTAGEVCSGEIRTSLDGACCIGSCGNQTDSSYKPWVGYTIAGVLFVVILFIFWRYKKTKGKSEFGKRVEDAEEKLK